jgi:hypothetical protein
MKYLKIYHLSKWNSQNQLFIQQTCAEVAKILVNTCWYVEKLKIAMVLNQRENFNMQANHT